MRVQDPVLADDDFGVYARGVDVAEHLGHTADGPACRGGPPRQLYRHHLTGRRPTFLPRRDEHIHQQPPLERQDVTHAVVVAIVAADEPLVASLQDANDSAFGAAAVLDALDAHDDAVAVHRFVEMRARYVDVAARLERALGRDEPVAGRMRLQPTDIEVHFLRQAEAVPADVNKVARGDQRLDVTFERRPLVAWDFENLEELAHAGGMMDPLTHERERLLARNHVNLG